MVARVTNIPKERTANHMWRAKGSVQRVDIKILASKQKAQTKVKSVIITVRSLKIRLVYL